MRFNPRIVTSVAAIVLTCFVSAAAYYYRSRKTEINDVMIFCKLHLNVFNYYDKLLSFIESAEQSIDVCMPSIHNPAIQGRLVQIIKQKNIQTRILIDENGYNESTAMFLEELADVGAQIKFKGKTGAETMHHKFCLVDNSTLITGTLDWGNDLSCDQWNYVYITNKPQLVQPVSKAFFTMWHYEQNNRLEITDSDTETKTCDSDTPAEEPPKNDSKENPAKTEDITEENSYEHNENDTTNGDIDRNSSDTVECPGHPAVTETDSGKSGVTETNTGHTGVTKQHLAHLEDSKKISGHSAVSRKSADLGYVSLKVPTPNPYEYNYPSNNIETYHDNYINANQYNTTQISNGEYFSGYAIDRHHLPSIYDFKPRVMPGHPDFNRILHEDFIASQKSTAF